MYRSDRHQLGCASARVYLSYIRISDCVPSHMNDDMHSRGVVRRIFLGLRDELQKSSGHIHMLCQTSREAPTSSPIILPDGLNVY